MSDLSFEAELWEYQGTAPWVFVTLPTPLADEVQAILTTRKPFGSVKVAVTTGDVSWETSLFPDRELGTYLLPVKKEVRDRVGLEIGDLARFALRLITH